MDKAPSELPSASATAANASSPASPSPASPSPMPPRRRLARLAGRLALGVAAALLLVSLAAVGRALALRSRRGPEGPAPAPLVDPNASAERLAAAIRIPTISTQDPAAMDPAPFLAFHRFLEATYPRAHAAMKREVINGLTLLYEWPGSDDSLAPILIQAHQDVVPVQAGTEAQWEQPPFGGVIKDGIIWGRGSLDIKGNILALMESVEVLAAAGRAPERTILFSFGHDEETGGKEGAAAVAAKLRAEGRRLEFLLDEGLIVTRGVVPGVDGQVALVGVAEKGYLTLELSVEGKGGHSSIPPRRTAAGILSRALARVEDHPLPGRIEGLTRLTFERLAPEMDFPLRLMFANLWLFRPLIERELSRSPETNAVLRTTTAVTMTHGSDKENVLPTRAWGAVNFRLKPGDTIESVIEHVRRAVDDPRVKITPSAHGAREASPVSSVESRGYKALKTTILECFPGAVAAPALDTGGTDSKHFTDLAENIYRFNPQVLGPEDLSRIHGVNERVAVEDHARAVVFFHRFLLRAAFGEP